MDHRKKVAVAAGLPDDSLVEILSRATARELHRSKCVSKGWRDLIADPLHRKKLPQTLQGFFPYYRRMPSSRGSYGGLLLFFHLTCLSLRNLVYIVFNPATEQWAAVPSEHTPEDKHCGLKQYFLVFDPAVSSHFQLVIFCEEVTFSLEPSRVCTVHSYS
ncbi:hypothetical protein HU200_016009 [Digitaria exilis]|uniref:F-box domain-containing protein n=1 Tax=Digitaria exilis TaxID=1010633 RepID=A0A835F987_9POAL|nr:hypothetical protein HU200_016009 [Digitaria exilis]CAB3455912.1 unnamed protein product [Digitaria exilis]